MHVKLYITIHREDRIVDDGNRACMIRVFLQDAHANSHAAIFS